MKIEYKDADGRVMELDVSDEIGQFYLSSVEEAEKSDRRNTRPDRHTSLETFVYAHGNTRHPFRLPERDAVHHIVFRPEACLCEAEDWREPVRWESVTYMGVGGTKKWERLESYGPKFVENIVQAVSRDILCYAMRTLRNCSIVATVHDEIIIEADRRMSVKAVCEQMGRTPPWAKGLLLRADGYSCEWYRKD